MGEERERRVRREEKVNWRGTCLLGINTCKIGAIGRLWSAGQVAANPQSEISSERDDLAAKVYWSSDSSQFTYNSKRKYQLTTCALF